MKLKRKLATRGFVTAICLFTLALISVMMLSLGSVGIMNLDNQQGYRVSSLTQYAARAAVEESIAQITIDNTYGASTTSLSTQLNNNITAKVNFASIPCSPCPQYYSVNNLAGSTTVNDNFGFPVPPGYVKINGYATYLGKQVVYSVLATPLPYSILAQSNITAGNVNGVLRDNVTSGSNAIAVTSATVAMTPDTSIGAISGNVTDAITGVPQITIPNINVAGTAANCGPPGGPSCVAQGCTNITGQTGGSLAGPQCYYSVGNFTMDGNSGGGFSMSNGARLYILGNLTVNGGPHLDLSGGPANNLIVVSGTITTHGNITNNNPWNVSILLGGVAGQNGISTNGPGGPAVTGFIYAQNGNVDLAGGSLTGSMIVKNGTASTGNVTYNAAYMNTYKSLFDVGIPLTALSSWQQ